MERGRDGEREGGRERGKEGEGGKKIDLPSAQSHV